MLGTPTLQSPNVVVGYSLAALECARSKNALLLINGETKPHSFDDPEGLNRWNILTFELGMAGLAPIPSRIENIRIEDKSVTVATEFYKKIKIVFDNIYVFDMERVEGLPIREVVTEYVVYDWFNIKRGAKQDATKIYNPDKFVNELVFYPSLRRDGNDGEIKDCYTKSFVPGNSLHTFENSGTAARLAALALLDRSNIKGPSRQIDQKTHYLKVALEHDRRDVYKHRKEYTSDPTLSAWVHCCNETS